MVITFVIVMVKTEDKVPVEIKVWTKDLQKYFDEGESVRVV